MAPVFLSNSCVVVLKPFGNIMHTQQRKVLADCILEEISSGSSLSLAKNCQV